MGLEKVIEQIDQEGNQKISTILHDAEMQAAEILQKTHERLDALSSKRKKETEQHIALMKIQDQSSVDIEAKKIRLNAEKDVLQQTFQESLAALASLPHEKILTILLNNIQKEMPDAAYISSNKRDEFFVRSHSKLTYASTIDCLGGIIVENSNHTMQLDYRYDTIAATVWEASLKEIADTLFR